MQVSSDNPDILRIKELNLEMILPNTSNMSKDLGGQKTLVIGKPGCFSFGTGIKMYDGSVKTVETVKIGDRVYGLNAQERTVLQLCRGRQQMYRISYDFGQVVVNEGHILTLLEKRTNKVVDIQLIEYLSMDSPTKENYVDSISSIR